MRLLVRVVKLSEALIDLPGDGRPSGDTSFPLLCSSPITGFGSFGLLGGGLGFPKTTLFKPSSSIMRLLRLICSSRCSSKVSSLAIPWRLDEGSGGSQ